MHKKNTNKDCDKGDNNNNNNESNNEKTMMMMMTITRDDDDVDDDKNSPHCNHSLSNGVSGNGPVSGEYVETFDHVTSKVHACKPKQNGRLRGS